MRILNFIFILFFLALAINSVNAEQEVIIYKSEACGHCIDYIRELKLFLTENNFSDTIEKDILRDKSALKELDTFTRENKIPYEMQGHLVVVINSLTIEGHAPIEVLEELFNKYPNKNFPKIVIFQDSMDAFATEYEVLLSDGSILKCSTERSFESCNKDIKKENKKMFDSFLLLVAFNAFIAGLHPCTLTVLLFFIAFLFTLRKSRIGIFKVGVAYILGIFIAYFSIGLGLLKAVSISGSPHIAAKIGAMLVLILGIFSITSFFTGKRITFSIPKFVKPTIVSFLQKATIPAVFIVGLIVGICSFGCTAGIYLSIMSLMLIKSQYIQGVFYLLLYNIMFILPLILILIIASNKSIVKKITDLEISHRRYLKLIAGIIMILLALIILWITGR